MVKKIGNIVIVFIFLLYLPIYGASQVSMRFVQDGHEIKKARTGVPFTIEIAVADEISVKSVQIEGVDENEILHRSTSKQIHTINGVRSARTLFQMFVRFNKSEIRTIGPVILEHDGGVLRATARALEIDHGSSSRQSQEELILSVNKDSVVVGEKIHFSIKLYAIHPLEIRGLILPDFENFYVGKIEDPVQGVELHNGKKFKYIEWKTTLTPKIAGPVLIPAVSLVYEHSIGARNRSALLGGLGSFFNKYQEKKIYSNTIQIMVHSLPPHDQELLVGEITHAEASVNQKKAAQGEGIVCTLIVRGDVDFEHMKHPSLQLPSSLSVYESKKDIVDMAGEVQASFEYILQAKNPGTFTIPAQTLTYFDIQSRAIQSISVNPLTIDVHEAVNISSSPVVPTKKNEVNGDKTQCEESKWYLSENEPWYPVPERSVSWKLFLLLFSFPFGVYLLTYFRPIVCSLKSRWCQKKRKQNAFFVANKAVLQSKKDCDVKRLMGIIHKLYGDLMNKDREITKNDMAQLFLHARVPSDIVEQWWDYYQEIEEIVYCAEVQRMKHKQAHIFEETEKWLMRLRYYFRS